MQSVELLGHAASFFVVTSLLMSNIKMLRYINIIGCVLFIAYGAIIDASPVVIMNSVAALINIYYLLPLRKQK